MDNKLNVSEINLQYIERKIVNAKLNLIDEYITFGRDMFDFEYLKSLNNFLFADFYFEESIGTRKITDEEKQVINKCLNRITKICLTTRNIEEILKNIKNLWYLQIFTVGNTRTLYAYLKVLNSAFLLGLNINPNIEIVSSPAMFDLNNFVNQNRLTKAK